MKVQRITAFNTSKWLGGTSTELFIYPLHSDYPKRNFIFRLSSATIDLERSEFTDLAGFQRFIAPLEGDLCLSHDDKNYKSLAQNEVYAFDGGVKTISKNTVEATKEQLLHILKSKREANKNTKYYKVYAYMI